MNETAPVSARLPPLLVKVARTSPAVRLRLSVNTFDDHGDAAGSVALVADFLVILPVAAQRLLDGALDIVLGHVFRLRGDNGGAQSRVHHRIGQADLGGNGDFARELAEQLGLHPVLPPLRCMMFLNCECPAIA